MRRGELCCSKRCGDGLHARSKAVLSVAAAMECARGQPIRRDVMLRFRLLQGATGRDTYAAAPDLTTETFTR
jgi:hypothetical protein